MTYSSKNLRDDIEKNKYFYINAPLGGKGKLKFLQLNRFDKGHYRSFDAEDRYWSFRAKEIESEEKTKWEYRVYPNRGGDNGGVVEAHWYTDTDDLGGHHELYPRAFSFE